MMSFAAAVAQEQHVRRVCPDIEYQAPSPSSGGSSPSIIPHLSPSTFTPSAYRDPISGSACEYIPTTEPLARNIRQSKVLATYAKAHYLVLCSASGRHADSGYEDGCGARPVAALPKALRASLDPILRVVANPNRFSDRF